VVFLGNDLCAAWYPYDSHAWINAVSKDDNIHSASRKTCGVLYRQRVELQCEDVFMCILESGSLLVKTLYTD